MPKYAARIDRNQPQIVAALREIGATVKHTHTLGHGFPDLIVGWRGQNYLLEVKDGEQEPARRRLTQDEKRWHDEWNGQVATVETVEQAYAVIGAQVNLWREVTQ